MILVKDPSCSGRTALTFGGTELNSSNFRLPISSRENARAAKQQSTMTRISVSGSFKVCIASSKNAVGSEYKGCNGQLGSDQTDSQIMHHTYRHSNRPDVLRRVAIGPSGTSHHEIHGPRSKRLPSCSESRICKRSPPVCERVRLPIDPKVCERLRW